MVLQRSRIFLQFISILILIATYPLILFSQTNEELLETIIKGVSYNESKIQSATFELDFGKYYRGRGYDIDVVKTITKAQIKEEAEKQGLSSQEIGKLLREEEKKYKEFEEDPYALGSWRQVGKARFLIKDNRIRIDLEYTQTIFNAPVDPHSDLEEEKYSENFFKHTYYYSLTDSYTIYREDRRLITGEGPQEPLIFPLRFGLRWYWSDKKGVKLFSEYLQQSLKEGKLKLAGQEEINGSMCYVLEVSVPERNSRARFWVDPNKGYTVSKMISSFTFKQEETEREFLWVEHDYTVKNLTGDVWIPEEGVEKYYQLLDGLCEKLDKPYCTKIENVRQYVTQRRTHQNNQLRS